MLTFLDSPEDTLAVVVADRVTSADLDAMMDRLEDRLARFDTVHVFAETRALDALELAGLGDHIARALPLFRQLRRFGRVAVVADQAWVRGLSRTESALLPGIGYRVFEPSRRDEALAWVLGARD